MIMPTKHTNLEQSLLGFGCYLLQILEDGATMDELWSHYQKDFAQGVYHARQSFDTLLMTLVFLYAVGAIFDDNGVIKLCA